MYYNTNNLDGQALKTAEKKTIRQEEVVLKIFGVFQKNMTASEVHKHFPKNIPITSVRRAITNLKNEGVLEMTTEKKTGLYGTPEHFYRVIQPATQKTWMQTAIF